MDARFSFYASILLSVDAFRKTLDSMKLLDDTSFNIFYLHYVEDIIEAKYSGWSIEYRNELEERASKLQNLLLNADNNINPRSVDIIKWYEYQHIIIDLCSVILGKYNLRITDESDQTPNELCREAKTAMNMIVKGISQEHMSLFRRIMEIFENIKN
jgi:hypothetical protein